MWMDIFVHEITYKYFYHFDIIIGYFKVNIMGNIPKTKKIDGKIWTHKTGTLSKAHAKKLASGWRDNGYKARIIKIGRYNEVYVRR